MARFPLRTHFRLIKDERWIFAYPVKGMFSNDFSHTFYHNKGEFYRDEKDCVPMYCVEEIEVDFEFFRYQQDVYMASCSYVRAGE